ncbi:MAG: sugar ABC transporter substrate-binding protein [Armatimonadota bacterium]|nr:sugar ABC transporter substrate-binding protein [Armatimonadota bacterium]MDR7443020.1 sugar ABC transporter substrate-binding protein [Armatimonadota bacterium]MDR7569376.1 sugar ABC transporter substrate-binding protein [Armatimonadota bacterium]MDR7614525.1 sugar ABC transporter substrate-binding protein [Armatimonadota bacterium]
MRRTLGIAIASLLLTASVQAGAPEIRLEFWTISLRPFFTDYITELARTYERQNPGVRVRWVDQPVGAVVQKLLGSLAAGTPPDVVNLNVPMTAELAQQGGLFPLGDLLRPEDRDRYFEGMLRSFEIAGKLYGLPWYVAPPVVAYHVGIWRRAGLDPDRPPRTAEELVAYAKRIKDRTGLYGFMPNVDGTNLLQRFQEAGLPILAGGRAVFHSDRHVRELERWVRLFRQDYFPEETLRRGYLGATERYTAGQLGMLITGPQFLLRVRHDNRAVYDQTRVGPYPLDRGRVIHAPLMGLAVPRTTRHPREAVRFALYVTEDRNQLAFCRIVTIFPTTKAAARDPFFTRLPPKPTPEDHARVLDARQLPYARDLTVVVPHQGELMKAFRDNVEAAFFGRKTPKQALDDAVRFWNARL